MKVLIIDDDILCINLLKQNLEKYPFLELKGVFTKPKEALNFLNKNKIDLIFLDVEMPDQTGFDFLLEVKVKPLIILTTSHEKYAKQAFDFEVFDFLIKPINSERLAKSILKIEKQLGISNHEIFEQQIVVRSDREFINIAVSAIKYVSALGDYVTIHTVSKKIITHGTIKEYEAKLLPFNFMRVHRSFIINPIYIKKITNTHIELQDDNIPLGLSFKPAVKDYFFAKANQ